MGRFQKVSAVDQDEDGEEEADVHEFGGQEHWQPTGMFCSCLTGKEAIALSFTSVLFGLIALTAATFVVNAVVRHSLAIVATGSLGARIAIGAVSIGVFNSHSEVSDIRIDNPPGYGGKGASFVTLQRGVFDMSLASVFSDPWDLKELQLSYIMVNIDQQADFRSNANFIVNHLAKEAQPSSLAALAEIEADSEDHRDLVRRKFIADRIVFKNIEASVCIHPACDDVAPVTFTIRRVVVEEVGKQNGGVTLSTLIHVITQALLVAVVQSAPGNLGGQIHRSFGQGVKRALDYARLHMDLGTGLKEMQDWRRWEASVLGAGSGVSSLATGQGMVQALDSARAAASTNEDRLRASAASGIPALEKSPEQLGLNVHSQAVAEELEQTLGGSDAIGKQVDGMMKGQKAGEVRQAENAAKSLVDAISH